MKVADFLCDDCGKTVPRTVPWWRLTIRSMCDRTGGRMVVLRRVNRGESL